VSLAFFRRATFLRAALPLFAIVAIDAVAELVTSDPVDEIPQRLEDTGLYADIEAAVIARDVLAFEPQYPLWTDGAAKHRWIRLPPDTAIDASDPDHLVFPRGTKLWKEFGFESRVETRYIALGYDGKWRFATYTWSADERSATLAPEQGVRSIRESSPGVPYDVPSRADCLACHEAGKNTVLGFTPLQLSADRDPNAPHARPKPGRRARSRRFRAPRSRAQVAGATRRNSARIAAATPRERAALGYLNTNCGICHSSQGELASLNLDLSYPLARSSRAPAIETTVERKSCFRWPDDVDPLRISRAAPDKSVLPRRMASRQPVSQMPPLGTHLRDAEALALVNEWIREDLASANLPQKTHP
jgi:hypothetical protein